MYATAQSEPPVQTVFGAGFIREKHVEGDRRNLPAVTHERRFSDFVRCLHGLVFSEVTKH
jgi:hypothetical protein